MKPLRILAVLSLAALAGCGVDGEPIRPTGALSVGVGPGGVTTGASVGATAGNVSVLVGL